MTLAAWHAQTSPLQKEKRKKKSQQLLPTQFLCDLPPARLLAISLSVHFSPFLLVSSIRLLLLLALSNTHYNIPIATTFSVSSLSSSSNHSSFSSLQIPSSHFLLHFFPAVFKCQFSHNNSANVAQ